MSVNYPEHVLKEAARYPELHPARVLSQSKNLYRVATLTNTLFAEMSGKLRGSMATLAEFPTVGDYVLVDRAQGERGHAIIRGIVPRNSVFIRKAAGTAQEAQAIAANIDTIFLCMALNHDFNLRRLERYLSIAWDSGATPVAVLTKADLCTRLEDYRRQVEQVAFGADIIVTSSVLADGYQAVLPYLKPGRTVAFLGSSGVGKSSLINRLLGEEAIKTQATGKEDKGRHTTTHRALIELASGAAVIDTPGMRELALESVNLSQSFADIRALAAQCRFKDCRHDNEPGCAVKEAIQRGELSAERLLSYRKLKQEAKYEGLNEKQIEKEKTRYMFEEFKGRKNARKFMKAKKEL